MAVEKQVAIGGDVWLRNGVPDWWLCRDGKPRCGQPAAWRTRAGKRRCADRMLAARIAPQARSEAAE